MTSKDETMSPPSPRLPCPPRILEIQNLPHVVLRELLPMLDTSSKRTLRLVSQNLRDLIDTQKKFQFNVILSDDTASTVLRFNHFDFFYFPRVLHRLQVTTLLSPLKVFSTSLSRCPLPPQIQVLEFTNTGGISQDNFLKLMNFYGRSNYMKRLKLNLLALEKVEDVKVLRQGFKLNFVQELELLFPDTSPKDIRFPRLLLCGTFPSLHTLSVNIHESGGYYPFLYRDIYLFVSRNLTSLKVVDVIHPSEYHDPKFILFLKKWTRRTRWDLELDKESQRLANAIHLHPRTRAKFQEQIDTSRLETLSMNFTLNEMNREPGANLGMTFLQGQKYLVDLELYNFPVSATSCRLLAELIQNCAPTLVTLKLVKVTQNVDMDEDEDGDEGGDGVGDGDGDGGGDGDGNGNGDGDGDEENNDHFQFDLRNVGHCHKLKTFVLTCDSGDWEVVNLDLGLPVNSLENLVLPRIHNRHLEGFRASLKLKSYGFAFEVGVGQLVELEKIQILLGDEGMPSLEKVTVFSGQWEGRRIRNWVKGRGVQKPLRDVTITKMTEVNRFTGQEMEKVILSRTPLT